MFAVAGLAGLAINAAVFMGISSLGAAYFWAWLAAWCVSIPCGYYLNKTLTFQSSAPVAQSLPKVVGIYMLQQVILLSAIALLVHFGVDQITAYWIAIVPAISFSFVAMRYFAFRT